MQVRESRVYFAGNIGGFDMRAILPRSSELASELAEFIATACNDHETLKADRIALQLEVNRLKMDMDIVRGSLEVADQAMQNAADVQAQLVAALRLAKAELYYHGVTERDMTDYGNGPAAYTVQAIETALAAAGATP